MTDQISFVVLEPDAVKVASPVLRGGWVSNDLSLPSYRHSIILPMFDSSCHRVYLGLLLAASVSLVACGSLNNASTRIVGVVTPYKIDIVQGNFVSREQADAVKPGMSRAQVRDILGTPLLASIFHDERWDYVFTFKRQGLAPQARKVTVFFKGDVLERMQ